MERLFRFIHIENNEENCTQITAKYHMLLLQKKYRWS